MKIFRAIMFFSAVMLAPAVVFYGVLAASWILVGFGAVVGGYSLYAGISEMLNL